MMEQVTRRSRHDWRRLGWGAIGVIGTVMLSLPGMAQFPPTAPIFEQVTLSPGLDFIDDPIVLEGISGGSIPARQVAGRLDTPTGACLGFVERAPDHVLTLTDFFDYLSLRVSSPEDTMLVVRGPGGSWCNDDYAGSTNPGLAGQWLAGTYEVWVGSYHDRAYHPYQIQLSQIR